MIDRDEPGARSVEVSVLVAEDHLASMDAVAASLQDAGVRVSQVLGSVGVITGTADDPAKVAALETLAGVRSVELGREIRLPPPDSPIQ
jgi:hypothetical protein